MLNFVNNQNKPLDLILNYKELMLLITHFSPHRIHVRSNSTLTSAQYPYIVIVLAIARAIIVHIVRSTLLELS